MAKAKVMSRSSLWFRFLCVVGPALLLTGCCIRNFAAYTPTPTKTPRSPEAALPSKPSFRTPTMVLFASPTGAIAQSTGVPATPTITETFTPVPTPKPGEPTYTPSPIPTVTPTLADTPTPTATATETSTPAPTKPGDPTYTATHTSTVTPPATDTPTSTPPLTPTSTETILPTATTTLTQTPMPTPSPTPTNTPGGPTPVPTPIVSGNWNLVQFGHFVSELDELHVLGVLENATGQDQESPNVDFTFKDEVGEVVTTDSCLMELTGVPIGGRAPFHLITFVIGYTTYEISVQSTISRDPLRTDLVVSDVQMFLGEDEYYVVTGTLTNPGTPLQTYAEVAVALLDQDGRVIGVGEKWLYEDLAAGQSVSFRIEVDEFLGTPVGYDIIAVGL